MPRVVAPPKLEPFKLIRLLPFSEILFYSCFNGSYICIWRNAFWSNDFSLNLTVSLTIPEQKNVFNYLRSSLQKGEQTDWKKLDKIGSSYKTFLLWQSTHWRSKLVRLSLLSTSTLM
jgi:hypothetical protein